MKIKDLEIYERLVIESLGAGKRDFTQLYIDVSLGWLRLNRERGKINPYRPKEKIDNELPLEVIPALLKKKRIQFSDGLYSV